MYYYQHHIGDYRRDTGHLTLLEHGIYRQLLDLYYITEKPLDANALRLICARSADEIQAAKQILAEFFILEGDTYIHRRCEDEISRFHEKSNKASESAKARWNKNNKLENANALQTDSERNANHKPITNKPITNNRGSRLPKDWKAPAEYIEFCKKERPDLDADLVADEFRDYWISVAGSKGVKLDWFATWRNWVRNQRSQPIKQKEDNAWRFDDGLMLKKAKELNIHAAGKTRQELIAAIDKKRGVV